MKTSFEIAAPGEREIVVSRDFDASAEAVFDAMTKPEILQKWYGLEGWTLKVCEIDLKTGGAWRFVADLPNGKTFGQYGVYREIERGRKLVNTENWEEWHAGETLVTTNFEETGGITTLRSTSLFSTAEVRDLILTTGIAENIGQLYQNLENCLRNENPEKNNG
ncbi:MAG: SRPBCC domain-containing protein [Pyrinomonadaceae bacterium]